MTAVLAILLCPLAGAAEPILPSLLEAVPAVYPTAALEQAVEATVLLELDIDAEGRVLDARVVESGGDAFDRSAVQALRDFRFTPAQDSDGEVTPATIRYVYRFEAAAAPQVSVEGRVREAGTRVLLADVRVLAVSTDGTERSVLTAADGAFRMAGLAEGQWVLRFEAPGLAPEVADITVAAGRVAQITVYPTRTRPWESDGYDEVIDVVGQRRQPEITERSLSAEEIRYLPGTNGDVVRVVQNLPGVARPPLNVGQLIIRGVDPEDSAYYLDGGQIPIVFHFGGLSTVLASDLLDEVSFLPGNYGVRYGRKIGGLVDLRTTAALPERTTGYASVDVFQAALYHTQRVGENTAITVSGRRSYIDAVLNPILNGGSATIRAPRYYDAQARVVHQLPSGTLDVLFLLSDDRFEVLGDADDADEVQISLATTFQKVRAQARTSLGRGWRNEATVVFGPEGQAFGVAPDGEAFERSLGLTLREEVSRLPDDGWLGWRLGADVLIDRFSFKYDVPFQDQVEEGAIWSYRPAVYAEPTFVWRGLQVVPGLRGDAVIDDNGYAAATVDPRLTVRQELGPIPAFKFAVGRYSQFPLPREVQPAPEGDGNPDLQPEWALQTGVGLELDISRDWSIEINQYTNWINNRIVGREDAFRFFTGPPPVGPFDTRPYANAGTGRVQGLETLVKYQTDRTVGWLAATISRSTRQDRP
ncbi:MAG: TonB family protein, partial [Myxococcota bacterium]